MQSRSTLGTVLTLAALNALLFGVVGFFTSFITLEIFAAITLSGCLLFFAGLTLLCEQLSHE